MPLPQGPPPDVKVQWRANERRGAARTAGYISLALSAGLFGLTGGSILAGDRSIITLFAFVMSLFLLDGAVTRLLASRKAPTAFGLSTFGLHVKSPAREVVVPWASVADMRFTSIGPRPDTLTITLRNGQVVQYSSVQPAIGSEAKLAWLEAQAQAQAATRGVRARFAARPAVAPPLSVPPDLLPSTGPQYWVPRGAPGPDLPHGGLEPSAGPTPAQVQAAPGPAAVASGPRPAWRYTQPPDGAPLPDPAYHDPPQSVRPLVWHFIPTGVNRVGALVLTVLVLLAAIAVTRLAADVLLSLAGRAPDALTATLLGLLAGAAAAAAVWRVARAEWRGEVAGSVLLLPAFDRTKVEIVSALREAGAVTGAGDTLERRSRGRLILRWRQSNTRATVLQVAPDTRAIVLRTVGRSRFELHARMKGAILERLGGSKLRK